MSNTDWKVVRQQITAQLQLPDVVQHTGHVLQGTGSTQHTRCPYHDDRTPSCAVYTDHFYCFACDARGDVFDWLEKTGGMSKREALIEAARLASVSLPARDGACEFSGGLTVEEYAAAKNLPIALLSSLHVTTGTSGGRSRVRMPYFDRHGRVVTTRYRHALNKGEAGDGRFTWKPGSKICLYGLWRLSEAPPPELVLVEGESDAHTLWLYGIPALGLAGASVWNEERDAAELRDVSRIYVVIEPDKGGEALKGCISRSSIRDRVSFVTLGAEAKDVSALHLSDPDRFRQRWDAAIDAATPWQDAVTVKQTAAADDALKLAAPLLDDPALFEHIAQAIKACGYAGDLTAPLIVYMALTSRVLPRPINLALVAPPASGKNRAIDAALALMPEAAYHKVSASSPRALIYNRESFEHRMVVFAEADSIPDDSTSGSAVRAIAEDNEMVYEVVEKGDDGENITRRIEKRGPTGLITTSTRSLPPQMLTRVLEITLADNPEQTRAIMQAHASQAAGVAANVPDLTAFIAVQEHLALLQNPYVVVPFAEALSRLLPDHQVRMRRDFRKLLATIQASALLYHRQRERDAQNHIMANIADYARARHLLKTVFEAIASEGITLATRQTIAAIAEKEIDVSLGELAERLGLARGTVSERVKRAVAGGWLINEEDRRGRPARLRRGEVLPDEMSSLPTPETVELEMSEYGAFGERQSDLNSDPNGLNGRRAPEIGKCSGVRDPSPEAPRLSPRELGSVPTPRCTCGRMLTTLGNGETVCYTCQRPAVTGQR